MKRMDDRKKALVKKRRERKPKPMGPMGQSGSGKVVGTVGYNPGGMPTPAPVKRYTKRVKA